MTDKEERVVDLAERFADEIAGDDEILWDDIKDRLLEIWNIYREE